MLSVYARYVHLQNIATPDSGTWQVYHDLAELAHDVHTVQHLYEGLVYHLDIANGTYYQMKASLFMQDAQEGIKRYSAYKDTMFRELWYLRDHWQEITPLQGED